MGKSETIEYLKARGIKSARLTFEQLAKQATSTHYSLFTVNKFDYMISHYLNDSDQIGYGIIPTNNVLKTESIDAIAIALVEGDDVVCINLKDNSIFLWLIQSGNSERLTVATSLEDFIAITKGSP